jgi:ABC-type transport system substrate-binding protein
MKTQEITLDAAERRRIFAEVQGIFAEHLPALYFAAPKVTVAVGHRVIGATPVLLKPHVLWNAEMLRLAAPGASGSR